MALFNRDSALYPSTTADDQTDDTPAKAQNLLDSIKRGVTASAQNSTQDQTDDTDQLPTKMANDEPKADAFAVGGALNHPTPGSLENKDKDKKLPEVTTPFKEFSAGGTSANQVVAGVDREVNDLIQRLNSESENLKDGINSNNAKMKELQQENHTHQQRKTEIDKKISALQQVVGEAAPKK